MIDVARIVNDYCSNNNLSIRISFEMPSGYEVMDDMYDDDTKTIYINLNNNFLEYERVQANRKSFIKRLKMELSFINTLCFFI